jgi:hypothetical protein
MSPSAWSQRFRHAGMVGSRGFEPRSARSERAASANCATSRDGPSGWTRTTTTRVKSPGCCVDTTEGMERMTGFEPVPQGLEGPRATVTPHSLWFGLRVSNPSLHAGNVECVLHTQAERGPVSFTGPSTSVSFQRPRSFELVVATAPGVEPGPTSFGGSDAPVTPRCLRHLTSRRSRRRKRHTLPLAWPVSVHGLEAKTKKAF